MRNIVKTQLDNNTTKVEIIENDSVIATAIPPSKWAFAHNLISDMESSLAFNNQPKLTEDEKSLLQNWMDEENK